MKKLVLFTVIALSAVSTAFAGITISANPASIPADNTSTSQVSVRVDGVPLSSGSVFVVFALNGAGSLIGNNPAWVDMNGDASITYKSSLIPCSAVIIATCPMSGESNSVNIAVTELPNQQPTCSPSANPSSGKSPLTVQFNANAMDSDGTIASYSWTFGDGGTSSEQNPSHVFQSGTYNVNLSVTDNSGGTASGNVAVQAIPNVNPVANPSATPTSGKAPLNVQFAANASDSDGTIASYSWTFGDGGTSSEQNPSHMYASAGTYPVTLTVTDNEGAVGTGNTTITAAANQPPVVTASATPASGRKPLRVNFTVSATDPDGTIASYAWDFGDGTISTEQNPFKVYNKRGTFNANVTVMDNEGARTVKTIVITVQ